jgi:hypothetical protein
MFLKSGHINGYYVYEICSSSLIIKTIRRYYLTPINTAIIKKTKDTSADENGDKRKPLHMAGGNVNYFRQYGVSSKIKKRAGHGDTHL